MLIYYLKCFAVSPFVFTPPKKCIFNSQLHNNCLYTHNITFDLHSLTFSPKTHTSSFTPSPAVYLLDDHSTILCLLTHILI